MMKDRRGKILYIGKAANLRNRVRQYFQPNTGDIRDFVPLLGGIVADIETTVTSNEKEALLLENTLIKKHQPRFNVKLRDDKNYLVLRLDPEAEWPQLEVVRRMKEDGAHYFGPYHSASACREALRVVNRHFQLRTCTDHVLHNRRRPCLQYQIKRCPAPCVMPVSRDEYGEQVRDVRLFLDGKSDELLDRLRGAHEGGGRAGRSSSGRPRCATRSGRWRRRCKSQRVVSADFCDQDVIGLSPGGDRAGDRGHRHPRRERWRAPGRSRSPTRSSRTRRSCRASSVCTTTCRRRSPTRCCCPSPSPTPS